MTFSAVRTTGIYCRPGCGARPRADNVRTFELAAAAEAAGYRACLRCRPYRVAGSTPWDAPELVCRGVQLIIAGVLDDHGEAELARRIGLSERHLRRLFVEHLGMTPDQFARSRRAHFARRLLDDTDLRVAEIAFASGFGSLRQFNRTMTEVFRAAPGELRARRRRADRLVTDGGLVIRLPFRQPYEWTSISASLAERAVPGVETVTGGVYRRTISLDGAPGVLEISPGGADHLLLRAHLPFWEGLIHVVQRAARMVAADDDAVQGVARLAADAHLGPLVRARPGVRPPGAWSGFEAAVATVAGPRVGELVHALGEPVPGLGHGLTHLFPSAAALADDGPSEVRAVARAVASGALPLDSATEPADLAAVAPAHAHEIALRLGYRDAFPISAPRLRRALELHGLEIRSAAAWRPWRSLAATYLMDGVRTASLDVA